jgi:hypothetical protein
LRLEDDLVLRPLQSIPKVKDSKEEVRNAKEWVEFQAMKLTNINPGMGREERMRLWVKTQECKRILRIREKEP